MLICLGSFPVDNAHAEDVVVGSGLVRACESRQLPQQSAPGINLQPGLPPQVLGQADLANIIRLQLARMRPGVRIKAHVDRGRWASQAHRIHIPLTAAPGVAFQV